MSGAHVPLREAAHGRWRDILSTLGFSQGVLSGKHGPCPICDGGKDRFRFDDQGRGSWICSHCGAGDGASLVMKTRGIDFKAAAALIEPLIGSAQAINPKADISNEECRRLRNEAWCSAVVVERHDPVGLYLLSRLGLTSYPKSLRHHPRLVYSADGSRHPAMLAMVSDPEGKPGNLHRTYLTTDGCKAAVVKPRMLMPGSMPIGGAVRLSPSAETMGIAEGIETALSASLLFGLPVWAALNCSSLSKWQPPKEATRVFIFADNDANFAGQHAAYQLANRLSARDKITVDVRMPDAIGADWNDVLRERATQAAC